MFNFLRNLTKSAEEKRQEMVAAYLDEVLPNRAKLRFEQEMAQDATLQAEVDQLRLVQQSLRRLPLRDVPRNFVLNPAEYRRPAPQPWVQAYPVLRTATALAAFFFIFAVVASSFTNLSQNEPTNSAPVADVAQLQEVETTRMVTESFAADEAADMAEEVTEEVTVMEAEAELFDETAEDSEAVEEVVEEAMEEEVAAAPPVPEATMPAEATSAPQTADSVQSDSAEDGATAIEPQLTPTVSTSPRVISPTPLPDRDAELAESDEMANDAIGDDMAEADAEAGEMETAVTDLSTPIPTPLPWLQIGLGLLLLLLAGLTFYAHKQRW